MRGSRVVARLPQVLWLTVVWVLLWGTVSARTVVGGLVVAALVTVLFPLPMMTARLPVRPLRLLGLAGFLLADLVWSGAQVSWQTLRHGRSARAGIIAVPLLAASPTVVALLAGGLSLTPGSYMLQIDRAGSVGYVYALGLHRPGDVERIRRQVLQLQRRLIAAFGTPDELAAADRGLTALPQPPAPGGTTR